MIVKLTEEPKLKLAIPKKKPYIPITTIYILILKFLDI